MPERAVPSQSERQSDDGSMLLVVFEHNDGEPCNGVHYFVKGEGPQRCACGAFRVETRENEHVGKDQDG